MKIQEEVKDNITVCKIEGEININTSPELRKAFDRLIRNDQKRVVVDFSGVSYIDSSGLATLVEMFQRLKRIGGSLRLCNMLQKVKNVFEITRLDKLFEIFDTLEEALNNF